MNGSILNSKRSFALCKTVSGVAKRGFTLIELLVVIAIIAILAAILLPALASAKVRAQKMQCMNQIKQLALGINEFTGDHDETFPSAGYEADAAPAGEQELSWDTWIYSYIGGGSGVAANTMEGGAYMDDPLDSPITGISSGLKIMVCPADNFQKIDWMTTPSGSELTCSVKTYEMVSSGAGQAYQGSDSLVQRDPANGLPSIHAAGFLGVGIYWEDKTATSVDWGIKGFPVSVVRDPSGTILLCEEASSQGSEGNIWPCCCCGPVDSLGNAWGNLYQIDMAAPQDASSLSKDGYNEGQQLYKAHRNRFSYAFHDGHVESLKYQDTLGSTGKFLTTPKGMWTIAPGD
jgi:prepilin-type N-terminal cleavage/methylation domain-containing protein/prepilin-type processing-associated H-X9-DG protein